MNSLLPANVSDTTPLQRLESLSQSSTNSSSTTAYNSEPSTPLTNGDYGHAVTGGAADSSVVPINNNATATPTNGTITHGPTTTTTTTLSLANHNNNNKIEIRLNNFVHATATDSITNGGGGGHKEKKMDPSNRTNSMMLRIFYDFIALCSVGLPILAFQLWGETYHRGFFCDDDSLKHPYKESTIKSWMLYLVGWAIPFSIIIATEFFKANNNILIGFESIPKSRYYIFNLELPDWIVESYKKVGIMIIGTGVTKLTTDVAKYSIGRLRPFFFEVCQPVMYDGTTCNDRINDGRYIENFKCSASDVPASVLKEAHLSFPSGHSSFVFFAMIYIVMYMQTRMTWNRAKMFKHLLQFLFLLFAWYVALTRVSDYRHHWTDVIAGSAVGGFYAFAVTMSL